jgi:hypothetical protein
LIDTLLQRGGDSLSQALYPLVAGFGLVGVAWSLAGVSLGMMAVAVWLGARFGARDDGAESAPVNGNLCPSAASTTQAYVTSIFPRCCGSRHR